MPSKQVIAKSRLNRDERSINRNTVREMSDLEKVKGELETMKLAYDALTIESTKIQDSFKELQASKLSQQTSTSSTSNPSNSGSSWSPDQLLALLSKKDKESNLKLIGTQPLFSGNNSEGLSVRQWIFTTDLNFKTSNIPDDKKAYLALHNLPCRTNLGDAKSRIIKKFPTK